MEFSVRRVVVVFLLCSFVSDRSLSALWYLCFRVCAILCLSVIRSVSFPLDIILDIVVMDCIVSKHILVSV